MRRSTGAMFACSLFLLSNVPATAQSTPNPAMNAPDQLAWQFFIQVNTRAGGDNALFETWASDTDTFKPNPQFPTTATPMVLRQPAVPAAGREALQRGGRLIPAIPPGRGFLEESRRNKDSFDFIVQNNLFKISGLRAAFGKTIAFPVASMEVKANWKLVSEIPQFTNGKVSLADVPKLYHVNTGSDGKQYAFVSMHIISKAVPNWTWATFEHKFNPGRCDIIGCRDSFGAQTSPVSPNASPGQEYPDCVKTPALTAMIAPPVMRSREVPCRAKRRPTTKARATRASAIRRREDRVTERQASASWSRGSVSGERTAAARVANARRKARPAGESGGR